MTEQTKHSPLLQKSSAVMVVMGDRTQCDLAGGLLSRENLSALVFGRAEDALTALDPAAPPSVIITGLSLPGLDGWEFCRLLRSPGYAAFHHVPILGASAVVPDPETARLAKTLGMTGFIQLPVSGDRLIPRVRDVMAGCPGGEGEREPLRVLVALADREPGFRCRDAFETAGYAVELADPADTLKTLGEKEVDLAVIGNGSDHGRTVTLLAGFREKRPDFPVIVVTETMPPGFFRDMTGKGAADCLSMPLDPDGLVERCHRIMKERSLVRIQSLLEKRTLELKASEDNFSAVFETFEDLFYQTDMNGIVTMISPSVYRLSGWTQDEIIGKPVAMVYDQPGAREDLLSALGESGYLRDYELCLVKKDGTRTHVSLAAHFNHDSSGAVTGVVGSLRDISHRKRIEEALKESEEKFRILTESSPAAIMLYQDNKWVYANSAATAITGYTVEEFRVMDFWDFVHPDDREMIRDRGMRRQKGDTERARFEFKIVSKSGEAKWVYLSGAATVLNGKPAGIISVLDISSRKQVEESLKTSEERFRTILDEMEVGYLEVGLDGKLMFFNEAFLRIFGYSREEMAGLGSGRYAVELDIAQKIYHAYSQMFKLGFPLKSFEWETSGKDGTKRIFELSASPIKDLQDQPAGFRGIVRDITDKRLADEERERLQNQLNQVQKMDSVGRLAGGVAHDFNNMLGVILGRTEIGLMRAEPGQPLYQDLTEIRKAAERSSDLTRQLLAFARKQTAAPRILELNEVVGGMLKMLQRLIGEDIDLVFLPSDNLPPIKMDPSQLDQILANLCVNARDAISGGGRVTIETGTLELDDEQCAPHIGVAPGRFVRLSVRDNGCGMDMEVLDKLFEPFFTTKGDGLGTGLGLSTVYGIVKQNSGFLDVESVPGEGSTFRICFPVHQGDVDRPKEETEGAATRGAETILLVEDEPMILEMTGMMLEHLGYHVLSTGLPSEAIRLVENYSEKIHMLLTDVVMPGMNGRDLALNLTGTHPDLKCMFMSGYTADVIASHGVLEEGVFFIQKPFTMKELAAKVRDALDAL